MDPLKPDPEITVETVWTQPVTLELREERAVVEKQREITGSVRIRRELLTRQETVTVDLTTERLVIELLPGAPEVYLGGVALAPGETREVVLYREEAQVGKQVVVSEQVHIDKRAVVEPQQFPLELRREELHVERLAPEARPQEPGKEEV